MRETSAAEAPRQEREQHGAEQEFGMAGAEELARLENAVRSAEARAERDPAAAKELAIAEKRLELFLNEHDNAGAFKFKRLGREMVGYFGDPRQPDKPKVIETDKEGMLSLAEGEKDRRMMVVNMGELDRINKEGGGHGAGDAALRETVRTIERIVLDRLKDKEGKETGYTMFRYSGNEFAVNFSSISKEDFDAILDAVREAKPPVEGVDEPPPLVADGFELQEAVDIVNQMQLELGPSERIDVSDPSTAAREIIDVVRRRANYSLDIDKFASRVGRVKEKISQRGLDGARPFFENYMKKMFQGTELAELESFADVSEEEVDRMALEHAKKFLGAASDRNDAMRDIVAARIKEIREKREGADLESRSVAGPERPGFNAESPSGAQLAQVPEKTAGQARLAEMEARAAEAEATGNAADAEIARLDLQIERARRDGGTGLLERGVHYESLEQAFKEGKEAQLVFVDMGFLKYFDHKGGPDVGDSALKLAASLMERAIAQAGVKGEAYRYGGDEFTIQIDGGAEEVEKFQAALAELRAAAGAVPTGKRGTKDGYHPTELVFNYGGADTATAERVFADLQEAGKFTAEELSDPDRVANIKAEIMTMIADKAIEEEKAVNRFLMLIDSLRDPNYGPSKSPARTTQVDNLINFSNKAIFAEAGGGEFLRRLAESEKGEQELRKEVQEWVAARVQEGREKEGRKEDLLTQLIELHGDIKFFERKLTKLRHENEEEKRRADKYLVELQKAREERQKLIDIRRTLGGEDKEAA